MSQFEKAIVRATGEVVTLRNHTERYTEILEDNHRVFHVEDLYIIEDFWAFLEQYLNNYSQDDDVALHDDIECALTGEADDEKLERVCVRCNSKKPEDWLRVQLSLERELMKEAARNFNEQN